MTINGPELRLKQLPTTLRLPVIAAPMFLVSGPRLVAAQCKAGIVGSFPALNARPAEQLDEWLHELTDELRAWDEAHVHGSAAPFAVNLIVHKSNRRLEQDLEICAKWKVPIVITSLGAVEDVNRAVHNWGGSTLHDVINDRFARKAIEKGADGLIAVAAGAGGHAGSLSPFALAGEIRAWFSGTLVLAGAIATGRAVLAAQAIGADLAYIGSPFIATEEACAAQEYKHAVVSDRAADVVTTDFFSGVSGNFLKRSIIAAGFDPEHLPKGDTTQLDFGSDKTAKVWRDIWSAGQGIGSVNAIRSVDAYVRQLQEQYEAAAHQLAELSGACSDGISARSRALQ